MSAVPESVYSFKVQNIDRKEVDLKDFQGRSLLIVNVASQCGFTSQYKGLEDLYRKFKDRGFVVLGFPCNQFGHQEPGNEAEIKNFCQTQYDVTFPLFAKIDVNGPQTHPLYVFLKKEEKGILGTEAIKWNFTKFLISPEGKVLKRFAPTTAPESLEEEIARSLPR